MAASYSPFEIIDGNKAGGLVLLCDHARNTVPETYGSLGLEPAEFERHIAYDIGAEALTRRLAELLNIPAVHSCFSRILIDPNRGADDPTLVMRLSDGTVVPGNHPITREEIQHRIKTFHAPYHAAIAGMVDACRATGVNPIVFSIHSYTHAWKGVPRPWEAAILWDADPRLPQFMIDGLKRDPALTIGDNEPYDGALRNDTMYQHATRRGFAQALLEVRQDLITDGQGIEEWAQRLAPLLEEARQIPDMHETRFYGSRSDGTYQNGAWTDQPIAGEQP